MRHEKDETFGETVARAGSRSSLTAWIGYNKGKMVCATAARVGSK